MRTDVARQAKTPAVDLSSPGGGGLLVPGLKAEPLPVREVAPSPCTAACPAGIEVKSYVSLVAERRFADALEVIRRRCPLPAVCGRVCHHPCEDACRRGAVDDPVAIRALKRYVTDREADLPAASLPPVPLRHEKVAIIGSGPAGLTAAYDLCRAGIPVTVFEAAPQPGGMLRYGIAEYRLPREVLDAEIDYLVRAGVRIETGRRLGSDLDLEELLAGDTHAVLLATGAPVGRRLGIPGEDDHPAIEDALGFLRRVSEGDHTPAGRRVAVIGGGSTAVEAARTARRLGAESVEILYRRSREEMLAGSEEIECAEAEGIRLTFLVSPARARGRKGRLTGIECVRNALGEPDAGGRRRPLPIPGSEFVIAADRVLAAVGQTVDLGFLPSRGRTRLTDGGRLIIDDDTDMTRLRGVFAAGDLATGPATVIDAIADGHKAAASIRRFLDGGDGASDSLTSRGERVEYELPDDVPLAAPRAELRLRPADNSSDFVEVEQSFTEEQAVAEARRCRRCGPCSECRACATTCHWRHIAVRPRKVNGSDATVLLRAPTTLSLSLDDAGAPGWLLPEARAQLLPEIDTSRGLEVNVQPLRARVARERCRGCGTCVEACPYEAITLHGGENGEAVAVVEPVLCRGCTLCTAACPTGAAESNLFSREWWESRLPSMLPDSVAPVVVLTCHKRAGSTEPAFSWPGRAIEVIRLRCAGQLDSGRLMELFENGAERVLITGCREERCRYRGGTSRAQDEIGRARAMLVMMGLDPDRIVTDWSSHRSEDDLTGPVARAVTVGVPAPGPTVRSGKGGER